MRRLARLTGQDSAQLAAWFTADAPLGVAKQLLCLDGPAQVRVTPDDDRCVAAEVLVHDRDGPARLSVEAWTTAG